MTRYFRSPEGKMLGAWHGEGAPPADVFPPGSVEIPAPLPPPAPEKSRADLLEAALIRKGVIAAGDIDAEKSR